MTTEAQTAVETAEEMANVASAMFGLLLPGPRAHSVAPQPPEPPFEEYRAEEPPGSVDVALPDPPHQPAVANQQPAPKLPVALPVPGVEIRAGSTASDSAAPAPIPMPTVNDGPDSLPGLATENGHAPAAPLPVRVQASARETRDMVMLREIGFLDD